MTTAEIIVAVETIVIVFWLKVWFVQRFM